MTEETMGVLDLGKSIDEISEPALMPEGWVPMEVVTAPEVKPNAAMKENPDGEKAGHNWVVQLASVHEEPQFNGRRFTVWLGVPKPSDEDSYTGDGQKMSDAKIQRIVDFVEAFDGDINGSTVTLRVGSVGQCYVLQKLNERTGKIENQIDIFNAGFKSIGAIDEEYAGDPRDDNSF